MVNWFILQILGDGEGARDGMWIVDGEIYMGMGMSIFLWGRDGDGEYYGDGVGMGTILFYRVTVCVALL